MTAETRSSVQVSIEQDIPEPELFDLAIKHLQELFRLKRKPEVIVIALEAFLEDRNRDVIVIKTRDSIAMMVDNRLKRIYAADLDSETKQRGAPLFLQTVKNLLL